MLKYIKHHLETIDGVEIYPMISLIIFVAFFAVVTLMVIRTPKKRINELSNYPLED